MNINKYYNIKENRLLDLNRDGCDFIDWSEKYNESTFAKHHKGFLIFIPPSEIKLNDEYNKSDPYGVEANFNNSFHRRRLELTLSMIQEALKSSQGSQRILDIGCGQGHITSVIKKEFPSSEVSAVDYSISAIEYANDKYTEIDFIVADAYNMPYTNNYFDIVVCNNLWEHVPDPLHLLSNISKIINPNGFLVISTPSRYRKSNLLRIVRGKKVELISKHHVTEYSVGQIKEQLFYGGYNVAKCSSRRIKSKKSRSNIIMFFMKSFVMLMKSHHQLESTVFYLAQRLEK